MQVQPQELITGISPSPPSAERTAVCCELIYSVARSGEPVRLKVRGLSMLPALWPGDEITVRQCAHADLEPGKIVLFYREGKLTAHRVQRVADDQVFTRGDTLTQCDEPIAVDQIAGCVESILRGQRRITPAYSAGQRMIAAVLRRSNLCLRIALRAHRMTRFSSQA